MTGRTHDLTAFTALHLILLTYPLPEMSFATAATAFGACFIGGLAPDLDQPTAHLWNRLPAGSIVSRIIAPIMGSHRMISHSIVGVVVIGWLLIRLLSALSSIVLIDMYIVWMGFMIGFLSHLVIDMFNRDGIPLLFPIPINFGIPPIRALRVHAGGIIEKTLIYPGLMILNGYLIYTHYRVYIAILNSFL